MSLTTILLNTSIVLARYLPYILGTVTLITSIFILKKEKISKKSKALLLTCIITAIITIIIVFMRSRILGNHICNFYYGGRFSNIPGDSHGHVRATGGPFGENIVYWRLPESEGGQVIVDNSWGTMNGNDLRDHLTGL